MKLCLQTCSRRSRISFRVKTLSNEQTKRTHLTPTGLLMEGVYTHYPRTAICEIASTLSYNPLSGTGPHENCSRR